jgi:hypothetical protein
VVIVIWGILLNTATRSTARSLAVLLLIALIALVVSGCGSSNKSTASTATGPGATGGAKGDAAGGYAVEAGKIRDPKDVAAEKKHFSAEPPPVQILTGNDTGYYVNKPTVIIAQSNSQWKAMKKKQFAHGIKKQEIAPIDFKTRQAVGLFLPTSPKGSELAITDVHQEGTTVVVTAVKLLNGKGCKAPPGKPRLFHIVETRKMTGAPNVKIKINTQKTTPCN